MNDFKQLLLEILRENPEPISTTELLRQVLERVGEGRWTASNVLTDVAALESWEWLERSGVAEEEVLYLTEKGRQTAPELLTS